MSAICGVIHLDGSQVEREKQEKMLKSLQEYTFDKVNVIAEENVFLCCGIQWVTKQSKNDHGLKHDKEKGFYYAADCFLDNRSELIQLLHIKECSINDSDLLYYAYQEWQDRIGDYVCGVFSFVIYDSKKQIVKLYTDHTGSRSLYVRKKGMEVYFSTVFGPILAAEEPNKIPINTKFIVGCLATISADMYITPTLTPFEGIYQILAGHYAMVDKKDYIQITYWTPFRKRKDYHHLKGEEAKNAFVSLFTECVNCLLQSDGETGATLSSGLDSSSIACLAAKQLQKSNQKLHSFTSVPMDGFVNKEDDYYIVNESFGPKTIQKKYPNLEPHFFPCNGKDGFLDMDLRVKEMECPYKSGQSMVWLNEIYETAQNLGVKVMLKGQYGNATISYGNILTLVNEQCHHLHFISAYRDFRLFMKKNRVRKKSAVSGCFRAVGDKFHKDYSALKDSIVKKDLLEKSGVKKQIKYITRTDGGSTMDSLKQRRNFLYYILGLSQLGAYDTRFGLLHKMVIRDPSKDKRLIEFCANIPMECFVHGGIERAMVRDYMRDIVPIQLLTDLQHRGLQCADYSQRVEKKWPEIYKKIMPMFEGTAVDQFCDEEKLKHLKTQLTPKGIPESANDLVQVMHMYSVYLFYQRYQ